MKPLPSADIKVNMLDLLIEQVGELYSDEDKKNDLNLIGTLLASLQVYKDDMIRRKKHRTGNLDDLTHIKKGIRHASKYLHALMDEKAEHLSGWHYGAQPVNMVQHYANVCNEVILELTYSVVDIEGDYPEMADWFKQERDAYWAKQGVTH
jgi:hypothetical protein